MPKLVLRVGFFMFILLSLTQISRSEPNEAKQTMSSDPSEFLLDSASASIQETLSPQNLSLPSKDTAPALEFEDQILPLQYSKDATTEALAEPEFLNASASAKSTDFPLPETETVTALPEVELNQANVNDSQITAAGRAPSAELTLPEVEALSAEPEADDGNNSLTKVSAAASPVAITLPEMDSNSTLATPLDEEVNELPASSSSFPNNHTTEDKDIIPPETEVNDSNSTVSDTYLDFTLPEVNNGPSQEASTLSGSADENVNMPSVAHNPPASPYNYVAEEETYDIVYEEYKDSWGSWAGDNPLIVAGGAIGVCFLGLAGLVYSNRKKKKTSLQYQSLSKGI